MGFIEELAKTGPKDIYELAVLLHDAEEASEFFVRQCQEKDRIIAYLAKIVHNELGAGLWDRYAQDVINAKLPEIPEAPFFEPKPFPPDNVRQLPVRLPKEEPIPDFPL